ncbi:hypothetical protein CEV31_0968 [Brucella thiophenivorans]|uniref:Uncharacterized protein n=1 Tax=Brucella thiophenivorans TaxID=571255 RepID=A0A256G0Q3_9HYPH|nr:hypothetical protein CEV31_0968 [Brucella thiophenivorans]
MRRLTALVLIEVVFDADVLMLLFYAHLVRKPFHTLRDALMLMLRAWHRSEQ